MASSDPFVDDFMAGLRSRNPGESEFHQAVEEIVASTGDWLQGNEAAVKAKILERITEPERTVMFRATACSSTARSGRTRAASASIPPSRCRC